MNFAVWLVAGISVLTAIQMLRYNMLCCDYRNVLQLIYEHSFLFCLGCRFLSDSHVAALLWAADRCHINAHVDKYADACGVEQRFPNSGPVPNLSFLFFNLNHLKFPKFHNFLLKLI